MLSCLHQGGSPGPFCSPPLSQRDRRRIEQMKLTRAAAAELKGENVEVVGFGGKVVAASAGLPDGWSAAVDGDGDTYYVRSQPCHLPRCCHPLPELDPASSRCAVEQGDGRDAVGGPCLWRRPCGGPPFGGPPLGHGLAFYLNFTLALHQCVCEFFVRT